MISNFLANDSQRLFNLGKYKFISFIDIGTNYDIVFSRSDTNNTINLLVSEPGSNKLSIMVLKYNPWLMKPKNSNQTEQEEATIFKEINLDKEEFKLIFR